MKISTRFVAVLLVALPACSRFLGETSAVGDGDASGSAVVGPSGGVVTLQDGVTLTIPAGALGDTRQITVREDAAAVPDGAVAKSRVYRFEPEGLHFLAPVTIAFTVPGSTEDVVVIWSSDTSKDFEILPTTRNAAILTAPVSHFSVGFAGSPPRAMCQPNGKCNTSAVCRVKKKECGEGESNASWTVCNCLTTTFECREEKSPCDGDEVPSVIDASAATVPDAGIDSASQDAGVCVPDSADCSGNVPRTCASNGQWQSASPCPFVCSSGHCAGVCVPAAVECFGSSVRTCDAAGAWGASTACPFVCSNGSCSGACAPSSTQCSGSDVQTCSASGEWQGTASCPFVCSGGACAGTCTPGSIQCFGTNVQTCDASGTWAGPVACVSQACVAGSCQGACAPGQTQCSGNGVQTCDASGSWPAPIACSGATPSCSAGGCVALPSCAGLAANCGPSGNESCCASPLVTGGTFYRSYDGGMYTDPSFPATVSAFRLDKYETTVGRFRKFVAAWVGGWRPAQGAGKHAHLNGGSGLSSTAGGFEPGWDAAAWNGYLGTTSAEWDANLASDPTMKTWTSGAGGNETLPITCATWYEHHAFCIWDGGFLPSEAEWNYAAAGGNLQRAYPWGAMDPGANASLAIWRCYYGGNDECAVLISADIAPVGSAAAGNGVYGQLDLAGNVMEWNLDWDADYAKPCDNCANTTSGSRRVLRGGGFSAFMSYLLASSRFNVYPTYRSGDLGARCARTP